MKCDSEKQQSQFDLDRSLTFVESAIRQHPLAPVKAVFNSQIHCITLDAPQKIRT